MGRENALKDYVEVNVRIMKFYEKYPNGRILTDIVSWQDGVIVMKATVYRDETDVIAATGHAYEKEGSSFINKTSALENCETSACGRALAMLGFEIKKSVASREEVANAQLQQQSLEPTVKPIVKQGEDQFGTISFEPVGPKDYTITEKQLKRFYTIATKTGLGRDVIEGQIKKEFGCEPKELTKSQYDIVCKRLEAKIKQ